MAAQTDMLELIKKLDPRIMDDMPQEVVDALTNGEIERVFRTSKFLPTAENVMGKELSETGEYGGSIYLQTKDGRTARWKLPEIADEYKPGVTDAGWNANKGHSVFFDNSTILNWEDQNVKDNFIKIKKALQEANPGVTIHDAHVFKAMHEGNYGVHTLNTAESSRVIGKDIFEYNVADNASHKGDAISEIYDADGTRHYFKPDGSGGRGTIESESIDDFFSGKEVASANAEKVVPLADEYDLGDTSRAVAANETLVEPPPSSSVSAVAEEVKTAPKAKPAPLNIGTRSDVGTVIRADRAETTGAAARVVAREAPAEARVASEVTTATRVAAEKTLSTGEKTLARSSGRTFEALEMAKRVTKGHGGATGLAIAGIATLLGVGAVKHKNNNNRR